MQVAGPSEGDIRQFVVLRHRDVAGEHFDLMIENGDRLATWKLDRPPEQVQSRAAPMDRIGEHRRIYLDYEGPISGDRGHVRQHDRGTCCVETAREAAKGERGEWRVIFRGDKLVGRYRLAQSSERNEEWSFERCDE